MWLSYKRHVRNFWVKLPHWATVRETAAPGSGVIFHRVWHFHHRLRQWLSCGVRRGVRWSDKDFVNSRQTSEQNWSWEERGTNACAPMNTRTQTCKDISCTRKIKWKSSRRVCMSAKTDTQSAISHIEHNGSNSCRVFDVSYSGNKSREQQKQKT